MAAVSPPPGLSARPWGELVHLDAPADEADRRATQARARRGRLPAVRIALLGGFSLTEDGVPRALPRGAQRLLALLALERRGISRAHAAALLTPHLEPASTTGSLRATLTRLRATRLPVLDADASRLQLLSHVAVDAWEFEERVLRLGSRPDDGADAFDPRSLRTELLPGWEDEWVLFERARLQELVLLALESRARQLARAGDLVGAFTTAFEALRLDPLRESAARVLIELQLSEGNHAQAVRTYLEFRRRVRQVLDAEPSEAMRALVAPLIAGRSQPGLSGS